MLLAKEDKEHPFIPRNWNNDTLQIYADVRLLHVILPSIFLSKLGISYIR